MSNRLTQKEHAPAPWKIERHPSYEDESSIFSVNGHIPVALNIPRNNAARIVECVNACEGIENPAAIKELFIAAVEFQAQAYIAQGCVFGPKIEPLAIRLSQALAALGVE